MARPNINVQYALFAFLIAVMLGTGLGVLTLTKLNNSQEISIEAEGAQPDGVGAKKLSTGSGGKGAKEKSDVLPAWMVLLIGVFVILQVIPLILAFGRSRRSLTGQQLRIISFLCEIPMYLGLLGSLVGVCVTQVVTGSVAAPLAYLTTITGILLYLFGRYTIVLALPEEMASTSFLQE